MRLHISALLFAAVAQQVIAATGPSTSVDPYLVPVSTRVEFTSILSSGDVVEAPGMRAYRMVGVPDGLGAYDGGDGSISVLMNHELAGKRGAVRAHGGKGAFVSRWKIRKQDLKVQAGEDLIRSVYLWDAANAGYVLSMNVAFNYFCSADLAAKSAFFNSVSGKGFGDGRLFLNGEEDGFAAPRGFAHVVGGRHDGTSYELPLLGNHPFENLLANPYTQDKTIIAATEDGGSNKVYVYVGEKQAKGSPVERAGLTNGRTYELKIENYKGDNPDSGFKSGNFSLVREGGTPLARPEDGAWDTQDPSRFYFATTASFKGNSRLWEMKFDDIRQPEHGGTIRVLIEGTHTGIKMMDNIAVDMDGNIYIQEDVGRNAHLGQIWIFNPKTGALSRLARHDPEVFLKGAPGFLSEDEESSGVIEISELLKGVEGYDTVHNRFFLLTVQTHHRLDDEVVEGGQLLLMKVAK